MSDQTEHPTPDELHAYSLGQLSEDRAVAIDDHISSCEPCCETIVSLSSDDTFTVHLKEARPSPGESAGGVPAPLADHPRYDVENLIGRGGMGDVYKARHRVMDRTVALKVINRELVRKPDAVDRFQREVKAAARLSHPNIVTAHDAEQAGDTHFLVMEYVDGVDLSRLVKDRGALPIAEACDYTRQAAVGLQHAHEQGMVHRDIKPHNLMLTAGGTVKILDFGLASLAPAASTDSESTATRTDLTAAGEVMGTPDFISPEQAQSARDADIRSDIYSLGATLYFLLSGQPPFAEGSVMHKLQSHAQDEPESLESLRDDVPADLGAFISKVMAKNPDERFQTPAEVAGALESILQSSMREQKQAASDELTIEESKDRSTELPPGSATLGRTWLITARCLYYAAFIPIGLMWYDVSSFNEANASDTGRFFEYYLGAALFLATVSGALFAGHKLTSQGSHSDRDRHHILTWDNFEALALAAFFSFLAFLSFRESVPDKLARMKGPDGTVNLSSPDTQVPVFVYTVESKAIGGAKPAAICDFGTCRIALLGQNVQGVRGWIDGQPVTIRGEKEDSGGSRLTDGRDLFTWQYSNGDTNCEFLDFKFRASNGLIYIGDDVYLFDPEESPGSLIVVDREKQSITTHDLQPEPERVYLEGSEEPRFQSTWQDPASQAVSTAGDKPELRITGKTINRGTGGLPSVHDWDLSGREVAGLKVRLLLAQNGKADVVQEFDFDELPDEFTSKVRLQVNDGATGADRKRRVNAILYVESPANSRCTSTNEDMQLSISVEAPFSNSLDISNVKPINPGETELLVARMYWKGDMTHGMSMESMTEATKDGNATFLFVTLEWNPVGAQRPIMGVEQTQNEPARELDVVRSAIGSVSVDKSPLSGVRHPEDHERLQGWWEMTSKVVDGVVDETNWEKYTTYYHILGHRIWMEDDGLKESKYRLNNTASPNTIDIRHEDGEITRGIYEFDSELLRFCFAQRGTGERPESFTSTPESKTTSSTLKLIDAPVSTDRKAIRDTWQVMSEVASGVVRSETQLKNAPSFFTFDDGQLLMNIGGRKSERTYRFVDYISEPKTINIVDANGNITRGICEFEVDTMLLCLQDPESTERPASFESTPEIKTTSLRLKRLQPAVTDHQRVQGNWTLTSYSEDDVPIDVPAWKNGAPTWSFDGIRLVRNDGTERLQTTFYLDRFYKDMHLIDEDWNTTRGRYELQGDTLRLWFSTAQNFPPSFEARPDSKMRLLMFERVKESAERDLATATIEKHSVSRLAKSELKIVNHSRGPDTDDKFIYGWNIAGRSIGAFDLRLLVVRNGKAEVAQQYDCIGPAETCAGEILLNIEKKTDGTGHLVNARLQDRMFGLPNRMSRVRHILPLKIDLPDDEGSVATANGSLDLQESNVLYSTCYSNGEVKYERTLDGMIAASKDGAVFVLLTVDWKPVQKEAPGQLPSDRPSQTSGTATERTEEERSSSAGREEVDGSSQSEFDEVDGQVFSSRQGKETAERIKNVDPTPLGGRAYGVRRHSVAQRRLPCDPGFLSVA
ncbi:MAG: protein kinase domain-containing protein [Planctomycetota bacterium]|jgi:uncharacterized protein (TIGR03067 family)